MKLTLLGGFLGSGKTTWLRHRLHHGLLADAAVVVNEAAEAAVDDVLLGQAAELHVLAGGCACCDGRDSLITLLRRICDWRVGGGPRLDRIVLETSGLADPGPIAAAIRSDPVLVHHIVLDEIVVTVDGLNGLGQLRREPLGRRQVELADRLVVTKIDAAPPETLTQLLASLRSLNPGAALCGSVKGSDSPLPDFSAAQPEPLPALAGAAPRAPIFATTVHLDDGIDWTTFAVWLSALLHARGDEVLRVKGVVATPAGRLLLQSVNRIMQPPEILPDAAQAADGSVVVIGSGYRAEDLSRSLRRFAGTA